MPVTENYVPHDEDMTPLLCQLLGKDPERWGDAGWVVVLVDAGPGGRGLDVSISTDCPDVGTLGLILDRVQREIRRARGRRR